MIRFTLFRIPVQVHWLFWVTCVVLGGGLGAQVATDWLRIAVWTVVVFVSILVHEYGHAFAGRSKGARPHILLHGLGGLTYLPGGRFSRGESIFVSAAGPAAGFALGILALVLRDLFPPGSFITGYLFAYAIWVNMVWTVFNLLPILPMDGGQILRELLGPRRAQLSNYVGAALAIVLCFVAFSLRFYIMAVFLAVLAYTNWQAQRTIQGGVVKQ